MPRTTIESGLNIVTKAYVGDGVDGRFVHCGFQPDLVIVKATSQNAVFRTSAHTGDDTSYFTNSANLADAVQSFTDKGFTVGTHAVVNSSGVTYHFAAFKADNSKDLAVGTYTGNGVDNRSITGIEFQPDLVFVKRNGVTNCIFRDNLDSITETGAHVISGAVNLADSIQALQSDGFQVGTHVGANGNGDSYYWFAFKETSRLVLDTYTGNGVDDRSITGVGFQPSFVVIKRDNATQAAIAKFATEIGDSSSNLLNGALTADLIQAFEADGFQVGTNAAVNLDTAIVHYYAWQAHRSRVSV